MQADAYAEHQQNAVKCVCVCVCVSVFNHLHIALCVGKGEELVEFIHVIFCCSVLLLCHHLQDSNRYSIICRSAGITLLFVRLKVIVLYVSASFMFLECSLPIYTKTDASC